MDWRSYLFTITPMSRGGSSLEILGYNVRNTRKKRGLTQEKLSELCELDPTYISMIERGKRNPSFTTLVTLAKNLGCPLSDLTRGI